MSNSTATTTGISSSELLAPPYAPMITAFGPDYNDAGVFNYRTGGGWSFPPSFLQAGPICLNGDCFTESVGAVCESAGGVDLNGLFCFFPESSNNNKRIIGPLVYGGTSWPQAKNVCENVWGGTAMGSGDDDIWCILDDAATSYGTVVGPVCEPGGTCVDMQSEVNVCTTTNGDAVGYWCGYPDQRTVLGPTCDPTGSCASIEAACAAKNGTAFGQYMCVVEHGSYSLLGPLCGGGSCISGSTSCSTLNGEMIGSFCLVEGEYDLLGPFCHGTSCTKDSNNVCENQIGGTRIGNDGYCVVPRGKGSFVGPSCVGGVCTSIEADCQASGGYSVGDFYCLYAERRQIVGPLFYSSLLLTGMEVPSEPVSALCDRINATQVGDNFCVTDVTPSIGDGDGDGSSENNASGSTKRFGHLYFATATIITVVQSFRLR